jgi:hypothetical protein
MLVIIASTRSCGAGAVPPMTYLRFFLLFPLGKNMPQLIAWAPSFAGDAAGYRF